MLLPIFNQYVVIFFEFVLYMGRHRPYFLFRAAFNESFARLIALSGFLSLSLSLRDIIMTSGFLPIIETTVIFIFFIIV